MNSLQKLVEEAKSAIENGQSIDHIINKIADYAGPGGSTDTFGVPIDQEYANASEQGGAPAGEHDPDIGNQRKSGPIGDAEKLVRGSDELNIDELPGKILEAIQLHNKVMNKVASHFEEIEIPLKDLHLDKKVDFHMAGRTQEAHMLIDRYLLTHVFQEHPYTIASVDQDMDDGKFFVKCVVFDRQLANVANVTNSRKFNKINSEQYKNFTKIAWKRRIVEPLGNNDDTGLVKCPLEGNFLVRACGTCPLAGNPHTYAVDGYVDCHFDDYTNLSHGNAVKEHRPKDNTSES